MKLNKNIATIIELMATTNMLVGVEGLISGRYSKLMSIYLIIFGFTIFLYSLNTPRLIKNLADEYVDILDAVDNDSGIRLISQLILDENNILFNELTKDTEFIETISKMKKDAYRHKHQKERLNSRADMFVAMKGAREAQLGARKSGMLLYETNNRYAEVLMERRNVAKLMREVVDLEMEKEEQAELKFDKQELSDEEIMKEYEKIRAKERKDRDKMMEKLLKK